MATQAYVSSEVLFLDRSSGEISEDRFAFSFSCRPQVEPKDMVTEAAFAWLNETRQHLAPGCTWLEPAAFEPHWIDLGESSNDERNGEKLAKHLAVSGQKLGGKAEHESHNEQVKIVAHYAGRILNFLKAESTEAAAARA